MTSSTPCQPIDVPDLGPALLEHAAYASAAAPPGPEERSRDDGRQSRSLPVRAFLAYRAAFTVDSTRSIALLLLIFLGFIASVMFILVEVALPIFDKTSSFLQVAIAAVIQIVIFWIPVFLWADKFADGRRHGPPS